MSCRLVTHWGGLGVLLSAAGGLVDWGGGVRLYRERQRWLVGDSSGK